MSVLGFNGISRAGICLILSCAALTASPRRAIDANDSAMLVPSTLLQAAENGTVEQFVSMLAQTRFGVGVILSPIDNRRPSAWRLPASSVIVRETTTMGDVLKTFHRAHPEYQMAERDGVILIQPARRSECAALIDRKLDSLFTSGPAFAVAFQAVKAINGDKRNLPPPGLVADDQTYRSVVTVSAVQTSLADVLSAIVRQVPGLGWAVRELRPVRQTISSAAQCNVVLFSGDSWIDTSWYLAELK